MISRLFMMTPYDHAMALAARGFSVVPCEAKGKRSLVQVKYGTGPWDSSLQPIFNAFPAGVDLNVGFLTGVRTEKGYLVDVDLDDEWAANLIRPCLPPTEAIFGRAGRPRTHYLYYTSNNFLRMAYIQESRGILLELRSLDCMTLGPGSIAGDPPSLYAWDIDGEPGQTSLLVLMKALDRALSRVNGLCIKRSLNGLKRASVD